MAHTFTAEDRAKAKAVREFKKQLAEETTEEPQDVAQKITDLQQLRDRRKLRVLEENENLAIELENKRMRDELSGITNQPASEKRSDLELFKQFTEVQNQLSVANEKRENDLRDKIIEQLANNDIEPESTSDILLKTLLPKLMDGSIPLMKKTPQEAPMPLPANIPPTQANNSTKEEFAFSPPSMSANNTMKDKTDKQIIDELPQYIKDAIKSGGLSMENVKQSFQSQGIDLTSDDLEKIEKIYKKIQGTKKSK